MLISVIIPHLNQPEALGRCLESLHAQSGLRSDVEIIVVDNGSARPPAAICARWPGVRLLHESRPGPGPARNRGIADAGGEILAFIDADCRADGGWLAAIERAFDDPDMQIAGGDVQVPFEDPARPTALECYERVYAYRNRRYVAAGFSGTGNMATRPEVFAAVGPFGGVEIAEDRDWGRRATALGYRIRYLPEMIVYHPARTDFGQMRAKWARHILHDFRRVRGVTGRVRWAARALAVALSPAVELVRILATDRLRGPGQRARAFACLLRVRLYRAGRMLAVLLGGAGRSAERGWNRGAGDG